MDHIIIKHLPRDIYIYFQNGKLVFDSPDNNFKKIEMLVSNWYKKGIDIFTSENTNEKGKNKIIIQRKMIKQSSPLFLETVAEKLKMMGVNVQIKFDPQKQEIENKKNKILLLLLQNAHSKKEKELSETIINSLNKCSSDQLNEIASFLL